MRNPLNGASCLGTARRPVCAIHLRLPWPMILRHSASLLCATNFLLWTNKPNGHIRQHFLKPRFAQPFPRPANLHRLSLLEASRSAAE